MTPPTPTDDRPLGVLEPLYARFDAIAAGHDRHGNSQAAHRAILDRLAANGRAAAADGWTACALERDGGSGRLRLIGVAPHTRQRVVVPDVGSA